MNRIRSYVHETIVKVKAHDFSRESDVATACLLDQSPSNDCDIRAGCGVKIRGKLSITQTPKDQNRKQKCGNCIAQTHFWNLSAF